MTSARALPTLLLVAILVFSASPLYAGSNASTNLSVTNFTITPDAGSVLFTAPWDGEASATAQDTSDPLQKHQFSSGFGKLVQANATTLLASGQASADAINLLLSSSATANTGNPFGLTVANGMGKSDILNTTFEITGGTGAVKVNFGAMLNGLQSLSTTGGGFDAYSSVMFNILINGKDVFSVDYFKQIGKNSSLLATISSAINSSTVLQYGQEYTIEVDDYAQSGTYDKGSPVPEPSALSLLFGGPVLAFAGRWILAKHS